MTEPPPGAPDPGEEPTRISRPAPGDPPPHDGGGGHGWQLLSVGLVALIVGAGVAWLIRGDSDDGTTTTTVREVRRTVTAPPPSTVAVTVTQPPAQTVVRTTTVTVPLTVTVPTVTAP
jgi:hypothetical protein